MSFDQNKLNNSIKNNQQEITVEQEPIIYSNTTRYDNRKEKKKQQLPEVDSSEPCYIHQLSVELITHIFSRLDPSSLATTSQVCSYWRHIVNDDSSWRDAFVFYFGCLPFKRLSTESWKTEYILRTHLIRKLKRGRGPVMTFNPKIGSLETMNVNFNDSSMLVASTEHGVAAKCNPMTGKVSQRHLLYSTTENIRLHISAVAMDASRILWGSLSGYITLTTRTQTASRLKVFSDFHHGPVTVLNLPKTVQDVVLSGGQDGNVKIWDVLSTSCVYTLYPASASARLPTSIEVTADYHILIGYDDGTLVVRDCNLNHLLQIHRHQDREDNSERRDAMIRNMEDSKIIINPPVSDNIKCLCYDSETNMVIVAYQGCTNVYKYHINTGKCVGVFKGGHFGTTITCMKWETSTLTSVLTLESAIKTPFNGNKKKSGSVIDISASSSNVSSGQTTPSTARTTRVLVTGDDVGTLCLWNGDSMSEEGRSIQPIRTLSGHIAAISSIYIDACKIVTGSDDGWIYMWDPLTGDSINILGNKIPKNAPVDRSDVNIMRVKNIWCNDYQGVATIGHQIKTWDFSPGKQFLSRRSLRQKGKAGNTVMRDRIKYELGREVKESIEKLEFEKEERDRHAKEMNKLSLGGLSDQEMLDYAMMLSQQEASVSNASPQTDFVDESDEDLMKAIIASLHSSANIDDENRAIITDDWPNLTEERSRHLSEEEDIDEELRYVLELSKTHK